MKANCTILSFSARVSHIIYGGALLIIFLLSGLTSKVSAQCSSGTPTDSIDFTGHPDSSVTITLPARTGTCCTTSNCAQFVITLDATTAAVQVTISGASASGSFTEQADCGNVYNGSGNNICINGAGVHYLSMCKSGSNSYNVMLTAVPYPIFPANDTVRVGCSKPLVVLGINPSTLTWQSIFPGNVGDYNSYLSCTSNCDTSVFTPQPGAPAYIDYQICGTATANLCVTNPNVCDTVRIYTYPALNVAINPNPAMVCTSSATTLTAVVNGGFGSYSYSWKKNGVVVGTSSTYSATSAGAYKLFVNDQLPAGCTDSATVNVTISNLSLSTSQTSVACNGDNSGTATVSASNGNAPYSYLWSDNETTSSISGLSADTYSVTVSDNSGCSAVTSVTITESSSLSASSNAGSIACNGGTTTVTVTASGGTPSYSGTGTFTVGAGDYQFIVTDTKGCTARTTGTVSQPSALSASSDAGAISCNGGSTLVTVVGDGGTPPYSGDGNFTITAGNYSYTVTDANGCHAITSGNVTQPTTLSASSIAGKIACHGGSTTVNISASGGTSPYSGTGSFSVSAGGYTYIVTDANGCTAATSGNVSEPTTLSASSTTGSIACHGGTTTVNVSGAGGTTPYSGTGSFTAHAGSYAYTITDANGCTATTSGNVSEPSALTASSVPGTISCNGGTTTVNVTATGGTAPYNGTGSFTVHSGAYNYIVTDANGCTATTSGNVDQPSALTASSTTGTISCHGGTTTVNVTASGGTSPYSGTGAFTVSAGSYSYTVTDANGCTATTSGNVTQPTILSASSSTGRISCHGGATTVNISASGGTSPYSGTGSFSVSAGGYTYIVTDANGCTATTSGSVSQPTTLSATSTTGSIACHGGTATVNVAATGGTAPYSGTGSFTAHAGGYAYTVTDADGCTGTTSGNITEPSTLTASSTAGSIACNGGTATVSVTASGGTAPYNGTGSFTVHSGTYNYIVTDANGCTAATSGNITQPTTLSASSSAGTIACNGGSTTVTVTATGGTAPYNGTGGFTRSVGSYSFTVTDANGCTATTSIVVTQPTTLSVACGETDVTCFSAGTATVTAAGGTPSYSYLWNTGKTTSSITGLTTGTFSVTVTDTRGCKAICSTTVNQPNPLVIAASNTGPVCSGGNICLSVSVTGGTGTNTYTWTGPNHYSSTSQNPCITNVTTAGGGTYTITVNSGICSKTTTTAATVYGKPTITFNYPNPVICQNTTVQLCAQGGVSYVWNTGATSACINIVSAGTYSVTGTDSHGCTNVASAPAIAVHCEEHCAYGQGFYGNGGKDCAQQTAPQLVATLLPPDLLLGDSSVSRSIVFLAGDASCVTAKLPSGGPPAELPAGNVSCATATSTHYLKNGRFNDVFVGQTLTLGLNMRLDPALGSVAMTAPYMVTYGVTQCVNGTLVQNSRQATAIPQDVLTYLGANNTIADLFALGNKALAGIYVPANHSSQPTISDISDAEDAINEAFDGCRMLVGFTNSSTGLRKTNDAPVIADNDNIVSAKAYPNPFNSTTTIEFTLPESSSLATVEVYNLTGAKVATLFHGYAEEGVTYKAEFNGDNYANGIYFYRITTDDAYYVDKLILIK